MNFRMWKNEKKSSFSRLVLEENKKNTNGAVDGIWTKRIFTKNKQ